MCFGARFSILLFLHFFFSIPLYGEVIQLSLQQAIDRAVVEQGNVQIRLQREFLKEAEARKTNARASLLPHLDGYAKIQGQTVNLEAFGIQPNPILGFPTLVGPFTTFDIRGSVVQNIFNLGAIRRYQAARSSVVTAEFGNQRTIDQIVAAVARTYLETLRAEATLASAESGIALSESLLQLAKNNLNAGSGTRVEVTRAEVQLRHEKQLQLTALNRVQSIRYTLKKMLGLHLDSNLDLVSTLEYVPVDVGSLNDAISAALRSRSDLALESNREESVRLSYESIKFERIPVLAGFANYGSIGVHPGAKIPTWAAGIQLHIPLFDGGAVDARRAEKASQLRQAEIKSSDLKEQIELEVRLAYQALQLTSQEIEVASEGLRLANEELGHARRRYEAGLTTNLEVTDTQNRLKRAEENRISALYNYNVAWVDLLEAIGTIQGAKLP